MYIFVQFKFVFMCKVFQEQCTISTISENAYDYRYAIDGTLSVKNSRFLASLLVKTSLYLYSVI